MDLPFRLGQLTEQQEGFLKEHLKYHQVPRDRIQDLVSALASVHYLVDVRLVVDGGPISGARLRLVADMLDPQFLRYIQSSSDVEQLLGLSHTPPEQDQQFREFAWRAYQRVQEALKRPDFTYSGVNETPAGHPLENRTDVAYYSVLAQVELQREEGSKFKVPYVVPVELRTPTRSTLFFDFKRH